MDDGGDGAASPVFVLPVLGRSTELSRRTSGLDGDAAGASHARPAMAVAACAGLSAGAAAADRAAATVRHAHAARGTVAEDHRGRVVTRKHDPGHARGRGCPVPCEIQTGYRRALVGSTAGELFGGEGPASERAVRIARIALEVQ